MPISCIWRETALWFTSQPSNNVTIVTNDGFSFKRINNGSARPQWYTNLAGSYFTQAVAGATTARTTTNPNASTWQGFQIGFKGGSVGGGQPTICVN